MLGLKLNHVSKKGPMVLVELLEVRLLVHFFIHDSEYVINNELSFNPKEISWSL